MSNTIIPMETNLASSGKQVNLGSTIEFDVGKHGTDRTPQIALLANALEYDQMIPFQVDIASAQAGYNLWEAPTANLRARAIIIVCLYGVGGILINPDGAPVPFPLAEGGWLLYVNPDGTGLTTGTGPTGPGIQKVTVDTENEARFQGYVFI